MVFRSHMPILVGSFVFLSCIASEHSSFLSEKFYSFITWASVNLLIVHYVLDSSSGNEYENAMNIIPGYYLIYYHR